MTDPTWFGIPPFHNRITNSEESGRPGRSEDLLRCSLRHAVRERELQALGEELLDIRTLHVFGLLNLDDFEDLYIYIS